MRAVPAAKGERSVKAVVENDRPAQIVICWPREPGTSLRWPFW